MSAPDPLQVARLLRNDFLYYAPRCLKIKVKAGRLEPFVPNQAQLFIHRLLEKQRAEQRRVRAIILKGRQQGASTYIGARLFQKTSSQYGKKTLILTHEQAATDTLFGMTKRFLEHAPEHVKPSTATDNAKELWFNRLDSRYKVATAGSKGTGRGDTAQYFHGSEVAFWQHGEDHMAGIGQTVPEEEGTEIILESTANGIGNLFHTTWQDAVAGESDYVPIFVPWLWDEGYRREVPEGFVLDDSEARYMQTYEATMEQMVWRRAKIVQLNHDVGLFNQEYPASADMAFQAGSKDALIQPDLVTRARKCQYARREGPVIMGVDPAEYGTDKSVIVVRQGRVVLHIERHEKRGTMEMAGLVGIAVARFKPDAINVDVTGVGTGVADRLLEMNYRNTWRVHFGGKALEDKKYLNKRAECWGQMKDWFEDEPCSVPDDNLLQADLTGLKYSYDSSRRLVIESKEKAKTRGLRSPDSADALSLTFAVRIAPEVEDDEREPADWRTA